MKKSLALIIFFTMLVVAFGVYMLISGPSMPDGGSIMLPQDQVEVTDPSDIFLGQNMEKISRVDVNASNVQSVVETLGRLESYELEAELVYSYNSAETATQKVYYIKQWVSAGRSKTEVFAMVGSGRSLLHTSILTADNIYTWEKTSQTLSVASRGSFSTDDFAHTPTYEDLLQRSLDSIKEGVITPDHMISVSSINPDSGYTEKWGIDIKTGLLFSFESLNNGQPVFQMNVISVLETEIEEDVFLLPTGAIAK